MQFQFQVRGRPVAVSLDRQGNGYRATIDGQAYDLEILSSQPGELSLLFEGRPLRLAWSHEGANKWIATDGCAYLVEPPQTAASARRSRPAAADRELRAPMPALVRAIPVAEGDLVEKGQTLLILEAMKMEIRLAAPRAGRVGRLEAQVGQTVQRDQLLAALDEIDPQA